MFKSSWMRTINCVLHLQCYSTWLAGDIKASVRGKFAMLHNFTFLSGWINLSVTFMLKKTP